MHFQTARFGSGQSDHGIIGLVAWERAFLARLNHKTRMRSNCIEICNKLLLALSSYDDLFRRVFAGDACGKAKELLTEHRMMMYCLIGTMYHYVIKDAEKKRQQSC